MNQEVKCYLATSFHSILPFLLSIIIFIVVLLIYKHFILRFTATVGGISEMFHRWGRQCRVKADAANQDVIERQCRGIDGQKYYDEESHQGTHR